MSPQLTPWFELDPQVLLRSTDGVAYLLTQLAFDGAKKPFFTYTPELRIEKAMWEDSSILNVVVPYLANLDSVGPFKLNFPHTWEVVAVFEGWGVTRGIDAVRDAFSKVSANDLKRNLYAFLFADSHDFPALRHRSLHRVLQRLNYTRQILDYARQAQIIYPTLSSAVDHLTAVFAARRQRLVEHLEVSIDHVTALVSRDFKGQFRTCTKASIAAVMRVYETTAWSNGADTMEHAELQQDGRDECNHCVKVRKSELGRLYWWMTMELDKGL